MSVDRNWVLRNLGFDPLTTPPPNNTFAIEAALRQPTDDNPRREIIDFDSEAPQGQAFLAFTTTTGLSRYQDIPWPSAQVRARMRIFIFCNTWIRAPRARGPARSKYPREYTERPPRIGPFTFRLFYWRTHRIRTTLS